MSSTRTIVHHAGAGKSSGLLNGLTMKKEDRSLVVHHYHEAVNNANESFNKLYSSARNPTTLKWSGYLEQGSGKMNRVHFICIIPVVSGFPNNYNINGWILYIYIYSD